MLKEGKWDKETTFITKNIVNAIKKIKDQEFNGINFVVDNADNVSYQIDFPLGNKYGTTVYANIKYDENSSGVSVNGLNNHKKNEIRIFVKINDEINLGKLGLKTLNKLIPFIKKTVRHELEHESQKDKSDSYFEKYQASPGLARLKSLKPSQKAEFASKFYLYLNNPAEIEANVAGFYKMAKTKRVPIKNIFLEKLKEIKNVMELLNRPEQDIRKNNFRLLKIWEMYAMSRFPKAKIQ